MPYVRRKFTEGEKQKGQYACSKVLQAVERLPFEVAFDGLSGILFGLALSHGMTMEEIVETIGWLTKHDSPDGRTSEQLVAAFRRGKAS